VCVVKRVKYKARVDFEREKVWERKVCERGREREIEEKKCERSPREKERWKSPFSTQLLLFINGDLFWIICWMLKPFLWNNMKNTNRSLIGQCSLKNLILLSESVDLCRFCICYSVLKNPSKSKLWCLESSKKNRTKVRAEHGTNWRNFSQVRIFCFPVRKWALLRRFKQSYFC